MRHTIPPLAIRRLDVTENTRIEQKNKLLSSFNSPCHEKPMDKPSIRVSVTKKARDGEK